MMMMPSRVRVLTLTAHVIASVGFLGAVATFLALAVAGVTSRNAQIVQAAYLAMELTTWLVIVPLCFASLLTGVVQSLGTLWGLFRNYWVLVKFLLTVFSTFGLLMHARPIGTVASVAARTALSNTDLIGQRFQLVVASGGAVIVLLVATALSVYKPAGVTRYGWHKRH